MSTTGNGGGWARAVGATLLVLFSAVAGDAQVRFPQEITDSAGTITVYQPQPEKLEGNVLTGRAAMSFELTGQDEPTFGAFWFTSIIDTDDETGMTTVRDIHVTKVRWPDSQAEGEARFTRIVEDAAARSTLSVSTERLSASLADAEREQRSLAELKHDPPKIVFKDELAVLLLYDGDPRWSDVEDSPYERAINTPFLVVRNKSSKTCYLSSGALWYEAEDPLGPWRPTTSPPADLLAMLPESDEDSPVPTTAPSVVVATEPTELIVSDGEPSWKPLGEGRLLYVQNTETPWLREVETNQIYVLLSGRWFRAASTRGPWTFVRADQLPESFREIPADSDLGGVRVSVAGTEEAEDAVLDAAVPQTAAIERSEAKLEVEYDGDPKFEPIAGTSVSYAVNTPVQVLQISSHYYAVDNGVWFEAGSPTGPWAVADAVPEDEIRKIPPSSPVYNTTYVHVYQSTPEVVYVGYTPGYLWSFPYYGVPVYGTGWYYRPYPGYYYPRPFTYGFHVGYNPWTGWNFGVSWSVGFMHFGMSWGGGYRGPWGGYYGGGYGCCRGWYGGYGPGWGGGFHVGYSRIDVGSINIGNNINFGNQGRISNNLRGREDAGRLRQPSVYNRPAVRDRQADRATIQRDARQARAAGGSNNVLTDRNGNVARSTPGGFEARDSGRWRDVDRAAASDWARGVDRGSLQRAQQSRQRGIQREQFQRRVPRSRPVGRGRRW